GTCLANSNSEDWSYINFLKLNSEFLVDLPPFLESMNALDDTWTRRFLREVKEIDRALYNDSISYFLAQVLVMETSDQLLPNSGVSATSWSSPSRLRLLCFCLIIEVKSEHADVTICRFWKEVISKRNRLKLRNVLDTESIELLKASSKFQSQKAQEDYKDLMKSSRSLDSTANNEVAVKKKKLPSNMLSDGTKLKKATPLNLIPSDDDNSSQDDLKTTTILPPKILPSGKDFNDIVAKRISANAKAIKRKKRLSAVKKAILCYGASQIIDLSAHTKQWFLIEDREFVMKDYKALLQVSEMPDGECSFIKIVEDMVHKGKVDVAFKFCTEKHLSSENNSYIRKISKIYADFIYKSQDQADFLDYNAKNTHTEMDVILKACSYIIEGLNKNLQIFPRWLGRIILPVKQEYRPHQGPVDVGEWEYSAKATASKAIGDRCRSARINQSISNGLLEYKLSDEQWTNAGRGSGRRVLSSFSGPKFELPTKLQNIGKLKTSISVIKSVMDIYKKTCEIIENLETTHHEFDDIFDDLDTVKPTTHFKSKQIHKPCLVMYNNSLVFKVIAKKISDAFI
ncbi:2845_t:CDS:10, partial [Funneliformis geosporum]